MSTNAMLPEEATELHVKLSKDLKNSAKLIGVREARYLVDTYYQIQKFRIGMKNQTRKMEEIDEPCNLLNWTGDTMADLERTIKSALNIFTKEWTVGQWLQSITGIGPVISAGIMAHFDIRNCPHAGHFIQYAGLNPKCKWPSREEARKAVSEAMALVESQVWSPVALYEKYATNPRPSTSADFEAGSQLMVTHGARVVAAVLPTLARCHNRDKLSLNIADFASKFATAVAFFNELLKSYNIEHVVSENAPVNFEAVRYLAEWYGRHPMRLYKATLDKNGKVTAATIATALCKRPWNTELKTLLVFKAGESFVKVQNNEADFYGKVFAEKKRLEKELNEAGKLKDEAERALGNKNWDKTTQAYAAYSKGLLPDAHVHARARRYAAKLFVSHIHYVMFCDYNGQPPADPWIIEYGEANGLGNHRHFIAPPNWPGEYTGRPLRELLVD